MRILVAIVFFVYGMSAFAQMDNPFKWTAEETAGNTIEVRVDIPDGAYLYDNMTSIQAVDSRISLKQSPDTKMKKESDFEVVIYPSPKASWTFNVPGEVTTHEFKVDYQGCSAKGEELICYMPTSISLTPAGAVAVVDTSASLADFNAIQFFAGWKTVDSASGYMNTDRFAAFIKGEKEADMFAGKSLLAAILLALVCGLALNLTPCVLPMLPITLSIIGAGAVAQSRTTGFVRGGIYALGLAAAYGVLGLLAALAGISFGTLNATPWFNAGIAIIFVVLALAMFDFIHIDFSRYGAKFDARGLDKGRLFGVFFLGVITALLAGACVAPALIAALLYTAQGYAAGNYGALLIPFMLGVGMALPWPLAGAGFAVLPKPGMWMNKVKFVFGLLILGVAIFYGYTAYSLYSYTPKMTTDTSDGTAAFLAAKAKGQPIVIDFWATWCGNCNDMTRNVLPDPIVQKALEGRTLIKWQAERPDDPNTRAVLEYFGLTQGLPAFAILEPDTARVR